GESSGSSHPLPPERVVVDDFRRPIATGTGFATFTDRLRAGSHGTDPRAPPAPEDEEPDHERRPEHRPSLPLVRERERDRALARDPVSVLPSERAEVPQRAVGPLAVGPRRLPGRVV